MLDKYDTSYITMFYFPDLQSYEKHLKVAKRLSVVRYNDLWPASQIQYFNQNSQPVYCSLLLHIRDGDQLQAETLLRYFKLNWINHSSMIGCLFFLPKTGGNMDNGCIDESSLCD